MFKMLAKFAQSGTDEILSVSLKLAPHPLLPEGDHSSSNLLY